MTYEEDQLRRHLRTVMADLQRTLKQDNAALRELRTELAVWRTRAAHLQRVIEAACEELNNNDEAGAYLILKNAVKELHEVHNAESLQELPVPQEPEVPSET